MLIKKTSFGYIVWLKTEEQKNQVILEKIEKLKNTAQVVVLCSGVEATVDILNKLANKSLI